MHPNFTYSEYNQIIEKYKSFICDYKDVKDKQKFALLRHDVEFSIERALEIARIDALHNVKSSFLFQVKSNAYNICSNENLRIVNEIRKMGHFVGLHFYVSHLEENDWCTLTSELKDQRKIFETVIRFAIDRFSFHRPPSWVLNRRDDEIDGLINMYGPSYFEFTENPVNIKYLADSMHRFKYGHPLLDMPFCKYQILLHPDEWSSNGLCEKNNFKSLAKEKNAEFHRTMKTETKNYHAYFKIEEQ